MSDKRNDTQDRAVKAYPPPFYAKLIKGKAKETGDSASSIVTAAVKQYFDNMPQTDRDRFLNISKNGY